jgi:hypothetical protein
MNLGVLTRFLAATVIVFSTLAEAQTTTGITIRVVDPSGAPILRSEIQIGSTTHSLGPALIGDATGVFRTDLPAGIYQVRVSAQGFRSSVQEFQVPSSQPSLSVVLPLNIESCPPGPCFPINVVTASEPEVTLPIPSKQGVPSQCEDYIFELESGIPVFFELKERVKYGVSLPSTHMLDEFPISLYLWVDNESDRDLSIESCSLARLLNIRSKTGNVPVEQANSNQACSVNIMIKVPAHKCGAIAKLNLDQLYRLPPDVYTILHDAPKAPSTNGRGEVGLQFQILRTGSKPSVFP